MPRLHVSMQVKTAWIQLAPTWNRRWRRQQSPVWLSATIHVLPSRKSTRWAACQWYNFFLFLYFNSCLVSFVSIWPISPASMPESLWQSRSAHWPWNVTCRLPSTSAASVSNSTQSLFRHPNRTQSPPEKKTRVTDCMVSFLITLQYTTTLFG